MVWNRAKPRIAIGVPHESKVTMLWAQRSLLHIYALSPWCDKVPLFVRGVPLSIARDTIVELALKDPLVTHIMWVDTDIIPEQPNSFDQAVNILYNCNEPIVSGVYRAKQATGFNYAMWRKNPEGEKGFIPIVQWNGNWLQVDTIGMGFCLVKREVYEKIQRPWYPWEIGGFSEDFNFCVKAQEKGYLINVITDVKLSHIGDLLVKNAGAITTLEA